jgi:hypothetical protein|tara:strand:- start:1293 stop:2225 length:933 start_codon:yes stop_codon:yes gene_type:complete
VDPILIDAGDALFDNTYLIMGKEASSKLKAKTVLESTAKMGNYYYNVGQSDFAAGFEFLREMEAIAGTNFISSNLVMTGTDQLAFNDHTIVERNGLKIGIFGITTELPFSVKEVSVKDYIATAKAKVTELSPQVDILVMLLNATKAQFNTIKDLTGVDYIFSSRETSRTRPERAQPEGKPFQYCFGIQGKYIGRFDLKIVDRNEPFKDVTSSMMTIKVFEAQLNNLQRRNPDKPLEEIYKNSPRVLDVVQKYKEGLSDSKTNMANAINTSFYSLIPMGRDVASEKNMLAVVDETLKTCTTLDKQGAQNLN